MAAKATFALKPGVWFRRGLLLIVSPELLAYIARCQADAPLIVLSEFPGPPLPGAAGSLGIKLMIPRTNQEPPELMMRQERTIQASISRKSKIPKPFQWLTLIDAR